MSSDDLPLLLDVNVLLALSWEEHAHHLVALDIFDTVDHWATTPATEAGLVRLLLTEPAVGRRVTGAEALGQLAAIRATEGWTWLPDELSLAAPVVDLTVLMGRRQVSDLHLVNLAAHHGYRLATFDASLRDWLAPDDRDWVDVWSS